MNRFKKEELRKYREKRRGLTALELEKVDLAERQECEFWKVVQQLHYVLFPEEYDFMFDSNADFKDRVAGINPMSEEYIVLVEKRRVEREVIQLEPNGLPSLTDDTWNVAIKKVFEMTVE